MIIDGTPWEIYTIDGIDIHVKREDLSCPKPGPSFSKIRGVVSYLEKLSEDMPVGVLDTVHSKAGWGVAYICKKIGMRCINFYPVYKAEGNIENHSLRHTQQNSKALGAKLVPLKAGRSSILYHQCKKQLSILTNGRGVMLPNALKLSESVSATATEVLNHTVEHLFNGTWVISISSGTIAAGVMKGLRYYHTGMDIYAHLGYSRSLERAGDYMCEHAGYEPNNLWLVDEGYSYKDKIDYPCPFPCNKYYDLKAWKWLVNNIHDLTQPIIFWNIGS